VGESEGDYPAGRHQELSIWVEAGSFVEDTVETIAFLSNRFGLSDFVLVGHCGGALTASYVAAGNRAVRGMFLISPPTVLIGARHEMDRAGIAEPYLKLYTSKVLSPEAWRRLLSGQSSYRTIARLVTTQIKRKIGSLLGLSATALVVAASGTNASTKPSKDASENAARPGRAEEKPRAFNSRLLVALQAAHSEGKTIEIVFGDRDPEVQDFRAFRQQHLPSEVATRIFDETSHGFITESSLALLFAEVVAFVKDASRPVPPAAPLD
jgi:pimeloyl-ACP methyl ester carboxylesterase